MRDVDLNLFVQAASSGFNDGAKVPSPFAAFVNALSDGIDQNYSNELKAQQAEQIRISNEQAPYEEAINQAKAERAKIETAAIQENPDAFKQSIITKAETDRKALEQKAMLQQQATTFTDIMQNGTSAEKADAGLGGKFSNLFAAEPSYEKEFQRIVPSLEEPDQKRWEDYTASKLAQQENVKAKVVSDQLLKDAEKDFYKDTGITTLANSLQKTRADLLLNGEVRTIIGGPPVRKPIYENDKPKVDANGNIMYGPLQPDLSGDQKERSVFFYKGEPQYGVGDSETFKTFNSYAEPYKYKNGLIKDQGDIGTTKAEIEEVNKAKELAKSQAEEEAKTANASISENQKKFALGLEVAGTKNKIAKDQVLAQEEINNAERVQATPSAVVTPLGIVEKDLPVVVSTPKPQATITPSSGQSLTPTPTPPPPGTKAYSVQEQSELARAKAKVLMEKRTKPVADNIGSTPATPIQQAANAVTPKAIPANVVVKIAPQKPSEAVVEKVNQIPALQKSSALFKAIAAHESLGDPNAMSPKKDGLGGVVGLAQTTLPTSKDIFPGIKSQDELRNPEISSAVGKVLLQTLRNTYKTNPMLALIGYNGGPGLAAYIAKRAGPEASWGQIQRVMPEAVRAKYPKLSEKGKASKAKELIGYPGKVLAYFPAFMRYQEDMQVADLLKEQGIFDYA